LELIIIETKSKKSDWITFQREFDKIDDVNEQFYYLRNLVDLLEICNTETCKIFPELHELDNFRVVFGKIITPDMIVDSSLSFSAKKKWNRNYQKYNSNCKAVFSKIFAMKTTKNTKESQMRYDDEKFQRYLQTCAKNGLTPNINIQNGIEDRANSAASAALPKISDKDRLDRHVKDIKKKSKKKGAI
jgi:hypothetical protein